MTLVVNLFAGPGAGKSTTAAGVFHLLKLRGVNAELVTEYAKDVVWERTPSLLENQLHVFAEQHRRISRLLGQVDVVVTDAPILLSLVYYQGSSRAFRELVIEEWEKLHRLDFFIQRQRSKAYQPAGHLQTEGEAEELDGRIWRLLRYHSRPPQVVLGDQHAAQSIVATIERELKEKR
jgi:hypothetical protein